MTYNELPYRQIHLDFHTSPAIPDVGKDFDAQQFVGTLQDAYVDSINVFAKCHHGMSYYPTEIGTVHPALTFDLLGEMITACHENGIKAPVYFPTGWEEVAADRQDWLEVTMDGTLGEKRPFESTYYIWRRLCHNKPSYQEFIFAQVQEIIDRYEVDGFWFDIVLQHDCICNDCVRRMRELGLDPESVEDVRKKDHIVITEFMNKMYSFVTKQLPHASLYFNQHLAPDSGVPAAYSIKEKIKFQRQYEIESLPSGVWGYNHFPLFVNYLNTPEGVHLHPEEDAVNNDINRERGEKDVIGMNGKFHKSWGDFGTLKNKAALEFEVFRMLANGAKCSIGDQMHPRGVLDKAAYELIGGVYKKVAQYEEYCRGSRKVAEIGVLVANKPLFENFVHEEGVLRMLMELHQPFDYIDFDADFSRYTVLVLPDEIVMTERQAEKVSRYMASGGKVIASYRSGMDNDMSRFRLEELGITYQEEDPYCPDYFLLTEKYPGEKSDFPYIFYEQGLRVRVKSNHADNGAEVWAYQGAPYFNRSYHTWCSHCQTPYEKTTDYPAVVRTANSVYFSHPIFKDYIVNGVAVYKELFNRALQSFNPKPLIKSNLPDTAELTVRRRDKRMVLHLLHYIPQRKSRELDIIESVIPLYDRKVALRVTEEPRRVFAATDQKELAFRREGDYISIDVPVINGYEIVSIELE